MEFLHPSRFIFRCDVTLHGGCIGSQSFGMPPQQLTNRLVLQLSQQIPDCSFYAAHGTVHVGAWKLVLFFRHQGHQARHVMNVVPQGVGRHLTVQN